MKNNLRVLPATARFNLGCCFLIVFLGILVYGNHLRNPFHFDSVTHIVNNRALQNPGEMLSFDFWKGGYFSRGLLLITLAWNAKLGGLNPFGYHLLNLGFHLINSLLIFFITSRLCLHFGFHPPGWSRRNIGMLSLFTALLFLCHPIQTESVIYIMSRSEVLAGTFYLTAILMFQVWLHRRTGTSSLAAQVALPVGMVLALVLGYSVKQTLATLPAILLLYYLFACSPDSRPILFLKRWKGWIGIALIIGLGLLFNKLLTDESFLTGPSDAGEVVGRKNYLLSQPPVILFYYIKLLFFPVNLNIDPDLALVTSPTSVRFWMAVAVLGFLVFKAAAHRTSRVHLFMVCWFLVVLSPSSSIVTLHDLAAEHRVYLAAYGFFFLFSLALFHLGRRLGGRVGILLAVVILSLGLLTAKRSLVWKSQVTLWEDTLKKSPQKTRPLINLARAHHTAGNTQQAIRLYEQSLKKDPLDFVSNYNLGELYYEEGRVKEALGRLNLALRVKPEIPEVYGKLGEIYLASKQFELAERFFRKAVELDPNYSEVFRSLGVLHYYHLNHPGRGLAYFSRSLHLDPQQPDARLIRRLIEEHRTRLPSGAKPFR